MGVCSSLAGYITYYMLGSNFFEDHVTNCLVI